MSSVLVVVNPRARQGQGGLRWPQLETNIRQTLGQAHIRVTHTTSAIHTGESVREALKEGVKKILVVGGDGTISDALQGFFENGKAVSPDAAIMIMPAGRGDDFFRVLRHQYSLKKNTAWEAALEVIRGGSAQPTDIGRVDFFEPDGTVASKYFINVASFGYPGLVVHRVVKGAGFLGKTWIARSAWTYVMQSAFAFREYQSIPLEVRVDGRVLHNGPIFSGFVLNGCYNAGGVCWSNAAKIDDGLFHVMAVEPIGLLQTLASIRAMKTGDWSGVKGVQTWTGRKVEVIEKTPGLRTHPLAEIDGDQPEPATMSRIGFEIIPSAVRFWR